MLRSMPVRRFKRGFKLGLIKLLIGDKAAGVHLSYVGRGYRIVDYLSQFRCFEVDEVSFHSAPVPAADPGLLSIER